MKLLSAIDTWIETLALILWELKSSILHLPRFVLNSSKQQEQSKEEKWREKREENEWFIGFQYKFDPIQIYLTKVKWVVTYNQ